jgi:outer membrane immunogenic protein
MRALICALAAIAAIPVSHAFAADMPLKAPAVPYSSYNWTGFYAGGEAGWGWATSEATAVTGGPTFPAGTVFNRTDPTGLLGGVYEGYNYQFNHIVVGIDGDYTWADVHANSSDVSAARSGNILQTTTDLKWLATLTGRLGYAVNNWLVFAKGGAAWGGWGDNSTQFNSTGTTAQALESSSETRTGWTVGGGLEYGLTPHITAKLEYDYVGFATSNFVWNQISLTTGTVTAYQRSATSSLSMLKLGMAYKF